MPTDILDDLTWRGLIAQQSDLDSLRAALASPVSLYCGFDPTADSLHVGSLVPLLTLRRFQEAGHRPIALVGGGTGLIGDPSGRRSERQLNSTDVVVAWSDRFRAQIARFLDFDSGAARIVDNYEWIAPTTTIEFLRDVGKHFTVNYMLAKESVSARLGGGPSEGAEAGISFTEFSYMLLQAYDYLRLHERYDCALQIGGSDQWGNITAGMELIRRTHGTHVHALTVPLVMTSAGTKFGKTEAGAVWLDPARTSPYEMYQFWLNTDDRDVSRYLRYFTFLPHEEIKALDEAVATRPAAREAQRALAREVTTLVHGAEEVAAAVLASEALFGSADLRAVPPATLSAALASAPSAPFDGLDGLPALPNLLVALGLCKSTSDARSSISQGGVYVNNERVDDLGWRPAPADLLHDRFLVVRRGRRHYAVAVVG